MGNAIDYEPGLFEFYLVCAGYEGFLSFIVL
jgi:hypothetical protein